VPRDSSTSSRAESTPKCAYTKADFNFDRVGREVFKIDNPNVVVVDRA
jgi:hypothetical protein